jgi:hypothetical protein
MKSACMKNVGIVSSGVEDRLKLTSNTSLDTHVVKSESGSETKYIIKTENPEVREILKELTGDDKNSEFNIKTDNPEVKHFIESLVNETKQEMSPKNVSVDTKQPTTSVQELSPKNVNVEREQSTTSVLVKNETSSQTQSETTPSIPNSKKGKNKFIKYGLLALAFIGAVKLVKTSK